MAVMNEDWTKSPAHQMIRIRVEATDTKLYSEYYEIRSVPDNWVGMDKDEQHLWLRRHAALIKTNLDDIQKRTDGVFTAWDNSHPEWTVVFTTGTTRHSEIISAPNQEAAVAAARAHIEVLCGSAYSAMLELTAAVEVQPGRYGL